jgi:hypothetical protein
MGCIAGGIAQAYYSKIPLKIIDRVKVLLPQEFLLIVDQFNATFGLSL